MVYGLEKKKEYNKIMEFRKINYLTLIYHFFTFNYTLGMYNKFNNEKFFRKSKMNVFFPLFTSLNNLEGRPLHLKKRPFALYYYSVFCREDLRETFLPFSFKKKSKLFVILFRYAVKNNFLFKKRILKTKYNITFIKKLNFTKYFDSKHIVYLHMFYNIFFYFNNRKTLFFYNNIELIPNKNFFNNVFSNNNKYILNQKAFCLNFYRKKNIKAQQLILKRRKKNIIYKFLRRSYKSNILLKNYIYVKK